MTTGTISAKNLKEAVRAIHIPPVYYFLVIITLVGVTLDQLFAKGNILSNPVIMTNILVRSVALGIVAVGQSFVMIGAAIDLSVAFTISLTAVMASQIMQGDPARVPMAILIVFAIGIVIGLANGLIVTKLNVNPFIATLGTGLIIKGILNGTFANYKGSVPKSFQSFGYDSLGPIPISVLVLLIVVIIGWFILSRTKFGAHLYGVGGSREIGRLSGLRTARIVTGAFIISSLTAVLSGLFIVSRLGSGAPWVGPDGVYDLESVARHGNRRHGARRRARRGVRYAGWRADVWCDRYGL